MARTQQQIQEKLAALPGVSSVGFASTIPTDGQPPNWDGIEVEGRPQLPGQFPPMRRFKDISPGFLEAMGTRLIVGRSYGWADLLERRPVILISENLAREYWRDPGAALGKRIGYAGNFREVLGVVGIYGVIAYTVAQRRREVGIRLALGAAPSTVSRMFLRRGVILCGAGGVLGLGGAVALSSLMKSLLFGVTPLDPRLNHGGRGIQIPVQSSLTRLDATSTPIPRVKTRG